MVKQKKAMHKKRTQRLLFSFQWLIILHSNTLDRNRKHRHRPMQSTHLATTNDAAAIAEAAAAAASQASTSHQRKRKHEAAPADYLERPIKWGKSPRDVTCTQQQFESMLMKPYGPRVNNDGMRKSGKDRLGHTLYFDDGLIRCQA